MDKPMIFYKAFDPNLCDEYGFQYNVGEETVLKNINKPKHVAAWAMIYPNIAHCIHDSAGKVMKCANPALTARICEVQPTGRTHLTSGSYLGKGSYYYLTKKLEVIRELSSEEIIKLLWDADAYFTEFIAMHAPFEDLYKLKDSFQTLDNARTLFHLQY